jgi:hypothetical protein
MGIKKNIRNIINVAGYDITRSQKQSAKVIINSFPPNIYDQDSLRTSHNHDFMNDSEFMKSYKRGVKACEEDYNMHWRVHVALWIASQAKNMEGDFVECGVNKGFLSSSIMSYVDWNSLKKRFFLFDTFRGIDENYMSDEEKKKGRLDFHKEMYSECYETVKKNFSEFNGVHIVRGSIPETLSLPVLDDVEQVCFLSIDMNCVAPEIAAAEFFWNKMVKGAWALLDDYAYVGYDEQKKAFDAFARSKGIDILSLPTGQGLYRKS